MGVDGDKKSGRELRLEQRKAEREKKRTLEEIIERFLYKSDKEQATAYAAEKPLIFDKEDPSKEQEFARLWDHYFAYKKKPFESKFFDGGSPSYSRIGDRYVKKRNNDSLASLFEKKKSLIVYKDPPMVTFAPAWGSLYKQRSLEKTI